MKRAVFPGTFDPVTRGHYEMVTRAARLFDEIVIAIGTNTEKQSMFSLDKRLQFLESAFEGVDNISIKTYKGLSMDFCRQENAQFLLRGIRTAEDFEYEASIARTNSLLGKIETIFMISQPETVHISSTIVRDLIKHKGNYKDFLPENVKL